MTSESLYRKEEKVSGDRRASFVWGAVRGKGVFTTSADYLWTKLLIMCVKVLG